ncbi:UDP-N-acetylmuramoyl-tripeptide--D-alanyl-D-alanine ligase [Simkania sp.]|uniref:UDP-N-acetylmuramoyl-tripeptide--D-alanyl-D- alanine ligase n=1 Tax=Simkania sp. TaxID=34094 RepID=UPI003B51B730
MITKHLREIGEFLGLEQGAEIYPSSAAFDSRKVERKGLFFALEGETHDGHAFLEEVAQKGALAAVVSQKYQGPDFGLTLFPVPDVRVALQALAKWFHRENPPYVIAITGTVGKTTTKEFIADLLSQRYRLAKPVGSANSQVSLPLMLLNQIEPVEMLVLEMGMSFPGEISKLVDIAPPDFGVLTKVSLVHSENFDTIDDIAAAKMELFEQTDAGLFNLETMEFPAVQEAAVRKTFYSMTDPHADYFLKHAGNQVVIVEKGKESPPLTVPFQATHLLENFLCATAVARMHELTWDEIQHGAAAMQPYTHRFQLFQRDGIQYVDDSYNASVVSVKAALDNLPKGKKTIALLGDMRELGKFSKRCHEEVAEHALDIVDHLLCIGNEIQPMIDVFEAAGKPVEKVDSCEEAKKRIAALATEGDVVLIKGSNSLKLWKTLD